MRWLRWVVAGAGLCGASVVSASTAILPQGAKVTGGLVLLDTKFETDNSQDFDVKGSLLFGGFKTALNPRFAVGGGVGLLIDGETSGDFKFKRGSGFRLGLDADLQAARFGASEVIGSVGFHQDRFNFKKDGYNTDLVSTDLLLGILLRHRVNAQLDLHGGLQIFLIDKGELESKQSGLTYKTDISRDEKVNLRLGAAFAATPVVDLRLDLLLLGEQTFVLAGDFKI